MDLETTGLSSANHEVTEISIIRATDRVQLSKNVRCEKPWTASWDALQITGKTLADLEQGDAKAQVIEECEKFFAEDGLTPAHRCIVGHNIYAFDRKFLHAFWGSIEKEFPAHLWLDTIPMIKAYTKQIGLIKPKHNLHAACDIVGVKKFAQAHTAKMDSRNSYLLWKDLVEEKKMNYLSFIRTEPHILVSLEDEHLDPSLLDY
jgi:DNA polymerase III epsilon subunit-like protein